MVTATDEALALLEQIKARHGDDLLFHQSGGCCDGSAPMCYSAKEFRIGANDVLLGSIADVPVYIGAAQHEYWKHTELTIDAVPGIGGMFSLDNGTGQRFLTRSDVCTTE